MKILKPDLHTRLPAQLEWEIDRYVLGDDTLDREAFEARMATEVPLALAVAKAVEDMHAVALACQSSGERLEREASRTRRWYPAPIALGASMLLAVGLGFYALKHNAASRYSADTLGISAVAESWIAIRNAVDEMRVPEIEAEDLGSGVPVAESVEDESGDPLDLNFEDAGLDQASAWEWSEREDSWFRDEMSDEDNSWLLRAARDFYQEVGT